MTIRRIWAVAVAQVRELLRRRLSILMLLLLPLTFYWTAGTPERAITYASVGVGWSVSVISLFLALSMRKIAPRLSLLGYSAAEQMIGRVVSLVTFSALVAVGLWFYLRTDELVVDDQFLALSLGLSVLTSAATGLATAALLPKEMEAMLLLIGIIGLTFAVDHTTALSKVLPLHGAERYAAASLTGRVGETSPWMTSLIIGCGLLVVGSAAVAWRVPAPRRMDKRLLRRRDR